jgi:futalosine hydrolase
MKLLLTAATKAEIEPLISFFGSGNETIACGNNSISIVITGVGMIATAYALGSELALRKYDLAINAGIAGSFDPSVRHGEIVLVKEDHFAELGAENNKEFLTIDEMGFGKSRMVPFDIYEPKITSLLSVLKQVKGITVNTVHGNKESIQSIVKRLDPQIETMEGAAFFYACNQVNLPSIQIRGISNEVEQRNTANWNIDLAVKNLNNYLIEFLNQL